MQIDNLPNLWIALDGCMEAHESSFSIKAHVCLLRKSTGGACPPGHLPAAHFGHAAPLAEENGRHLLGTRLPGHTLVTPRFLRKRTGGTFWARGFQSTLWSRRASCGREKAAPFGHEASRHTLASCGREKAAPFGHEASRAHCHHAVPLFSNLLGTRPPTPTA